ncbi:hypothetical protein O5D80_004549 [Batrachochytrium dendrobatidis]|nr:hypothetical protein O5D80_004549 [Batrachochytrium dendrobatidis]
MAPEHHKRTRTDLIVDNAISGHQTLNSPYSDHLEASNLNGFSHPTQSQVSVKHLYSKSDDFSSDSEVDLSEKPIGELNALLKLESFRLSKFTKKIRQSTRTITKLSQAIERLSLEKQNTSSGVDSAYSQAIATIPTDKIVSTQSPHIRTSLTAALLPVTVSPLSAYIQSFDNTTSRLEKLSHVQHEALFQEIEEAESSTISSIRPMVESDVQDNCIAIIPQRSKSITSCTKSSEDRSTFRHNELFEQLQQSHASSSMDRDAKPDAIQEIRFPVNSKKQKASAELNTEWMIKRNSSAELMTEINSHSLGKFDRKPRTLLLPPENPETLSEIAVTSTLSGCIQWWNIKTRQNIYTIEGAIMRNGWAEDMCWISPNTLAVASSPQLSSSRANNRINHQIALVYNCRISKQSVHDSGSLDFKIQHLKEMPHDKSISTISPMSPIGNQTRWVSAGADKRIFLWSFENQFTGKERKYNNIIYRNLHNLHTSNILSVYPHPSQDVIYSGGLDHRLVGWSLGANCSTLCSNKQFSGIRDIIGIPGQPNMLLLGFMDYDSQIKVLDLRSMKFSLSLSSAMSSADSTSIQSTSMKTERQIQSKYAHASIHPNGYMVSLGQSANNGINIWDLRYSQVNSPTQTLRIHDNRVIVARFFEGFERSSLVSMSTDNTLSVSDYKLS